MSAQPMWYQVTTDTYEYGGCAVKTSGPNYYDCATPDQMGVCLLNGEGEGYIYTQYGGTGYATQWECWDSWYS